jgi:hypothetical protein
MVYTWATCDTRSAVYPRTTISLKYPKEPEIFSGTDQHFFDVARDGSRGNRGFRTTSISLAACSVTMRGSIRKYAGVYRICGIYCATQICLTTRGNTSAAPLQDFHTTIILQICHLSGHIQGITLQLVLSAVKECCLAQRRAKARRVRNDTQMHATARDLVEQAHTRPATSATATHAATSTKVTQVTGARSAHGGLLRRECCVVLVGDAASGGQCWVGIVGGRLRARGRVGMGATGCKK